LNYICFKIARMHLQKLLGIEFFLLFFLLPISLIIPYNPWVKFGLIVGGFVYIIYVLLGKTKVRFRVKKGIGWSYFWKRILTSFIIIAVVTAAYVYIVDSDKLFCVPRTDKVLWVRILFIYTFLSVWPQEIIYRTFFFERYGHLFRNERLAIFINAVVFSLAHLLLQSTLVLVLTFIGGLLFGYTYMKTRSTTLVSIEHAIYGNWLFSVGMGGMLAFPGMGAC